FPIETTSRAGQVPAPYPLRLKHLGLRVAADRDHRDQCENKAAPMGSHRLGEARLAWRAIPSAGMLQWIIHRLSRSLLVLLPLESCVHNAAVRFFNNWTRRQCSGVTANCPKPFVPVSEILYNQIKCIDVHGQGSLQDRRNPAFGHQGIHRKRLCLSVARPAARIPVQFSRPDRASHGQRARRSALVQEANCRVLEAAEKEIAENPPLERPAYRGGGKRRRRGGRALA